MKLYPMSMKSTPSRSTIRLILLAHPKKTKDGNPSPVTEVVPPRSETHYPAGPSFVKVTSHGTGNSRLVASTMMEDFTWAILIRFHSWRHGILLNFRLFVRHIWVRM